MLKPLRRDLRLFARSSATALLCLGTSAMASAQVAYSALTNNPVEVPNFLAQPFTGMVTDSEGVLYAVNPQGNTIVAALGDVGATPFCFGTGLNPVSLAVVEDRPLPGDRKLLVVCRGTHGLFVHDAVTGELEGYRQLESEPADIAYDEELQRAFVTCQGTNAILQFDPLAQSDTTVRYQLPVGERPGYLHLDLQGPSVLDDRVYVAAAVTGNNTITSDLDGEANFGIVTSLAGHAGGELDDFDVFVIDPGAQTMVAAIQHCGSLLFDLERFPGAAGGDLWVLATDSINADPALPDEPALKGRFAFNRVQLVPGVSSMGLAVAGSGIDLDDYQPRVAGAQYRTERSINQARALDFAGGKAYVASPFSDIILELNKRGQRTREFQLPAGAQCFDIEPIGDTLYALCLGTLTIESFDISSPVQPRGPFMAKPHLVGGPPPSVALPALPDPLDLGADPTPVRIRRGRDVWFDGKLSANGRFSCAACHEGGMSDQLGWQISDFPSDVKDVMVTQSLLSIQDTYPHHWRGERDLLDFQGAFAGLLGAVDEGPQGSGRDITEAEMADFNVFVRSLQAPANPHQALTRRVDDAAGGGPSHNADIPFSMLDPLALATQGKFDYESVPVPQDADATCADCHGLETGSDGNLFPVNQGMIPRGFSTETPHFRQLQNKGRLGKLLSFDEDDNGTFETQRVLPNNGFGFGHEGRQVSLRDFVDGFEATVDPLTVAGIFRFIDQFDQGIAPAAHWATWFDADSGVRVPSNIAAFLISGTAQGWSDLAVVGRVRDMTTVLRPMRWWFDPQLGAAGEFVPEDTALPNLDWTSMQAEVAAGDIDGVFLGLPPAAGERFAIDYDGDGLRNVQDASPYDHDVSLDDGLLPSVDSVVVDYATARMAKLRLVFSEDVAYAIDYRSDPGNGNPMGPALRVEQTDFVRLDTIVLPHNEPSTPANLLLPADVPRFFATITLTDRNGNTTAPLPLEEAGAGGLPLFVPDPYFPESLNGPGIVAGLGLQHVQRMALAGNSPLIGTAGDVTFEVELDIRSGVGAPNYLAPGLPTIFPPGTFPDEAVFLTVSHDAGGAFEKVSIGTGPGQLSTSHATTIEMLDATSGLVEEYTSAPQPPWVVSPFLDVDGDTSISFTLHGLPSGTTVRVAVMGIIDEDPDQTALHGSTVFSRGSLSRYQALKTDLSQANGTHLDLIIP